MAKLVIVESPEKAKTIQNILGSGYKVVASKGHIRDLPKKELAVDVEHGFVPKYEEMPDKKAVISALKKEVKNSEFVYLATDPDREGEAISWHLASVLKLGEENSRRVTFNEITRRGVARGMENPRAIDMDLVNSQQTRRILDRIVGYQLSPFLWKKVAKGLSAGRVQSVVVRLVLEREREIRGFEPKEYWTIEAELTSGGHTFTAKFYGGPDGEIKPGSREEAEEILKKLEGARFRVVSVKTAGRRKSPAPPLITSTLQQAASKRFGMTSARTMQIAQRLYEGINVAGVGEVGLITYMRTDSLRIADEAAAAAAEHIRCFYGERYLPPKRRFYKNKRAQDAHEAIRPTMPDLTPAMVRSSLTLDQYRIYKLVWDSFIASQMADCLMNIVSAELEAGGYIFKAGGSSVEFDGYTVLYGAEDIQREEGAAALQSLSPGDAAECGGLLPKQHFTAPPARYNEGTLIAAMEELGIGRPSTYAPIISTILRREYVERENKNFKPTPLGEAVTVLLEEQFPRIVDTGFTARMEENLDGIEDGSLTMLQILTGFYNNFSDTLRTAAAAMEGRHVSVPAPVSDQICEKCGRPMLVKTGKFGKFFACSGYPECKSTKPYFEPTNGFCPVCGKPMQKRFGKSGAAFYGCTGYPDCKFMSWDEPIAEKCPKCGTPMFRRTRPGSKPYCAREDCGYNRPPARVPAAKKSAAGEKAAEKKAAEPENE